MVERTSPAPPADATEQRLVAALRARDEAAFQELVDRYGASLLRVARLYVSSRAVAEEVVQETWLAVLAGIDRFEGRSSLKTWLFRILANRAKTRAVREARTVPFSAVLPEAEGSESAVDPDRFLPADHPRYPGHWASPPRSWSRVPEEQLLGAEARAVIADAIAELPAAQQAVISLRDVEGWGSEEVRELLDLSEVNQRVLLHRARSKVRAALERYFDPDAA